MSFSLKTGKSPTLSSTYCSTSRVIVLTFMLWLSPIFCNFDLSSALSKLRNLQRPGLVLPYLRGDLRLLSPIRTKEEELGVSWIESWVGLIYNGDVSVGVYLAIGAMFLRLAPKVATDPNWFGCLLPRNIEDV
jgi:hypothetical protein